MRPNDVVVQRSDQHGIARLLRQTHALDAVREVARHVALTHLDRAVEAREERERAQVTRALG